jgi:hypothetical protein
MFGVITYFPYFHVQVGYHDWVCSDSIDAVVY